MSAIATLGISVYCQNCHVLGLNTLKCQISLYIVILHICLHMICRGRDRHFQQYFSYIWASVLLVEETGVLGDNLKPAVRH
jgi:hypothetical protein